MLTLMLRMGQPMQGAVILKMEKQIAQMDDEAQAAVFSSTVKLAQTGLPPVVKPVVSIASLVSRPCASHRQHQHRPVAAA